MGGVAPPLDRSARELQLSSVARPRGCRSRSIEADPSRMFTHGATLAHLKHFKKQDEAMGGGGMGDMAAMGDPAPVIKGASAAAAARRARVLRFVGFHARPPGGVGDGPS